MGRLAGIGVLLLGVFIMTPVSYGDEDHNIAKDLVEKGEILPLADILIHIGEHQPGNILEVELEKEHGKFVYEVEWLDNNGVVWEMKVDAATGELLKREKDD